MDNPPTPGRLYMIKSRSNHLILEVEESGIVNGTKVHCWEQKPRGDLQIWSYDPQTFTIRTKLNPIFCLDFDQGKNHLVVNPFNPQSVFQQWVINGGQIKSRANETNVFDVYGFHTENGSTVGIYQNHGGENQKFDWVPEVFYPPEPVVYGQISNCPPLFPTNKNPTYDFSGAEPSYPAMGQSLQGPTNPVHRPATGGLDPVPVEFNPSIRKFLILTDIDGKSLDIRSDNHQPGAQLILYKVHHKKNQQWYLDQTGFIRALLNNYVFYNKDKGQGLTMQPYQEEPGHQWKIDGKRIVNLKGEVLDIRGGKSKDGAEICAYTPNNQDNQNWHIEYV